MTPHWGLMHEPIHFNSHCLRLYTNVKLLADKMKKMSTGSAKYRLFTELERMKLTPTITQVNV